MMTIALVVNLACASAAYTAASFKESPRERLPIRQWSVAIHRAVRRLVGVRHARQDRTVDHPKARTRAPRSIPAPSGAIARRLDMLPALLLDLPPPTASA